MYMYLDLPAMVIIIVKNVICIQGQVVHVLICSGHGGNSLTVLRNVPCMQSRKVTIILYACTNYVMITSSFCIM